MTVCILILSIIGSWCVSLDDTPDLAAAHTSSALIGECTELHRDDYICVVDEADIPLFLSVYDTAISDDHP